ncbi:MAG TPA: hypothetical protein VKN18_23705, partial [Blastocatellia bacterium]|nr:hypothetical protein [Blastocatellia bacterium]
RRGCNSTIVIASTARGRVLKIPPPELQMITSHREEVFSVRLVLFSDYASSASYKRAHKSRQPITGCLVEDTTHFAAIERTTSKSRSRHAR